VTTTQISILQRLYAGPVNPRTGERIYAGLTPGSEDAPLGPIMQGDPDLWPDQQFYPFRWTLGASFASDRFDFDHDLDRVDGRLSATLNANSADLSAFARRGGKLILYSGLADPAVPFAEVVDFYDRLDARAGGAGKADAFARLFLVPGMGHCFGGPGATELGQPFTSNIPVSPDSDILMALVAWTEGQSAPSRLIAHKPAEGDRPAEQRPVCAYPALPQLQKGPADRKRFLCMDGPRGSGRPPAPRYLK
jgi:feruloyl esterase